MRILHVAGEYPPHRLGGIATFLENVVARQAAHAEVAVLVVKGRDYHADPPSRDGAAVRVEHLDLGPALAALPDARELRTRELARLLPPSVLLSESWDVVHAHDWYGVLPAAVLAGRAAVVMTAHLPLRYGFTYANHPFPLLEKTRLEALGFRLAERVLVPSRWVASLLEREYSVSREKIHLVPNGVDLDEFAPGVAPRAEQPTLLAVSRLSDQKGLDHLLQVLRAVREKVPAARLVVVGDGPRRAAFEAEARALGLDAAVEVTGWVPHHELGARYASAHAFVSTSIYEPFGLTTLEAMAAGCPVVVSEIGGSSDFVRDDVDGFLRHPEDPRGFADAAARLLLEPELGRRASASARERAGEYAWSRTTDELVSHVKAVSSRRSTGGSARGVVLAWHIHQPFFAPDDEVRAWAAESYRPLLRLHEERGLPLCLNVSGALLERLAVLEPAFVEALARAVRSGIVELLGSGKCHPLLPVLPFARARAQVLADVEAKQRLLGVSPRGFWPADLGWSHTLVPILSEANLGWTIVDSSARLVGSALPAWDVETREGQSVLAGRQRPLIHESEIGRVARLQVGDHAVHALFRHHELSWKLVDLQAGVLTNPERARELADEVVAHLDSGAPHVVLGDDGERVNARTLRAYARVLDELVARGLAFSTGSRVLERSTAEPSYLPASTFLVDFSAWQSAPDDLVCFRMLDEVERELERVAERVRSRGDAALSAAVRELEHELLELEDSGFYFWKFVRRTREPFIGRLHALRGRLAALGA